MANFLTITPTRQTSGGGGGGRCPPDLYKLLRSWRPGYRIDGQVLQAQFENVTFWRDTNEWAAYYWMNVRGARGMQTEKFVWTFRHGQYRELCQVKPRGTQWRLFAG